MIENLPSNGKTSSR